MFLGMSLVDLIQSIGVLMTIVFSIIGLVQAGRAEKQSDIANNLSEKANKHAEKANKTAEKALSDSQKDYMPLVKFVDNINVVKKNIKTLRNENIFDYDEIVLRGVDDAGEWYDESSELLCIEAKIKNCGKGIIKSIKIDNFFIQEGNKVSIRKESQEELDCLCFIEKKCEEYFVLGEGEETIVNFMFSQNLNGKKYEDLDEAQNRIREFFDTYDNMTIGMDLLIDSLNDTSYTQDFLMGTVFNNRIVHNSVYNLMNI